MSLEKLINLLSPAPENVVNRVHAHYQTVPMPHKFKKTESDIISIGNRFFIGRCLIIFRKRTSLESITRQAKSIFDDFGRKRAKV